MSGGFAEEEEEGQDLEFLCGGAGERGALAGWERRRGEGLGRRRAEWEEPT